MKKKEGPLRRRNETGIPSTPFFWWPISDTITKKIVAGCQLLQIESKWFKLDHKLSIQNPENPPVLLIQATKNSGLSSKTL
ncbi:hypothetical protein HMPREF9374_1680 [Desmospora sp. 8437]|nr:hypothetical protein HMPREF9374_1680 [Desmospora sp. 8437]